MRRTQVSPCRRTVLSARSSINPAPDTQVTLPRRSPAQHRSRPATCTHSNRASRRSRSQRRRGATQIRTTRALRRGAARQCRPSPMASRYTPWATSMRPPAATTGWRPPSERERCRGGWRPPFFATVEPKLYLYIIIHLYRMLVLHSIDSSHRIAYIGWVSN